MANDTDTIDFASEGPGLSVLPRRLIDTNSIPQYMTCDARLRRTIWGWTEEEGMRSRRLAASF